MRTEIHIDGQTISVTPPIRLFTARRVRNKRGGTVVMEKRLVPLLGDQRVPSKGLIPVISRMKNGQVEIYRESDWFTAAYGPRAEVHAHNTISPFVRANRLGLIRLGNSVSSVDVVAQVIRTFPDSRIFVLGPENKPLRLLYTKLRSQFQGKDVDPESDEPDPLVTFSTFGQSALTDRDTYDVVMVLPAESCTQRKAIEALRGVSARYRLFGLQQRPTSRLTQYQRDVLFRTFGPDVLELPSLKEGQRTIAVEWHRLAHPQVKVSEGQLPQRPLYWYNDRRNQLLSKIARELQGRDSQGWIDGSFPPRLQLNVTILTEDLEHAYWLARRLPDWPIVTGNRNFWGFPKHKRSLLREQIQREPHPPKQIVLVEDAGEQNGQHIDCVVWAGGGQRAQIPQPWLRYKLGNDWARNLLIVDIEDCQHSVSRKHTRKRKQAYRSAEIFELGTDLGTGRIKEFLRGLDGVAS